MTKALIALSIAAFIAVSMTAIVYAQAIYTIATLNQTEVVQPTKVIPMPLADNIESQVNQYRVKQGKPAINSEVAVLDAAATARAEQMCKDDEWAHDSAWKVLDPLYEYQTAGENLYFDYLNDEFASKAVAGWVSSKGHRENMLKDYQEMGIGVKYCPDFQGYDTAVIVVNYFGIPR